MSKCNALLNEIYFQKVIDKVKRHTVSDGNFILKKNNLARRWSPWKLAMTQLHSPINLRRWTPCRRLKIGYHTRQLFKQESRSARVLYEIAVQTTKHGKKYVMFCKWGWTNANPFNWIKGLLRKPILAKQLFNALNSGCRIFVRRCVLNRLGKKQAQLVKQWRKMYSYAWADGLHVTKNTCLISS